MVQMSSDDIQYGNYQVDFESLIKILGENLYSNPKVAIRELIQNASDSCVRRRVQEDHFQPVIHLSVDYQKRQLIIEDNGAGMLRDEVIRYLASIGGGLTREARKRLMTIDQESAQLLIGQFGIGFLSAFVISNRVIVETCAMNCKDAVYWQCEGTTEYQIGQGKRTTPGTKITLCLKPAHFDLLETDTLKEAIIHYADFIAFPIYLNKEQRPINRMNAPWHTEATENEYSAYIQHRYGVLPLALEAISIERDLLQAKGVLFVLPRTIKSAQRSGVVDLFQKRMYLNEDAHILPDWAAFVSGVLDCPTLDLVASRESAISERQSYKELQEYLAQSVGRFVKRLAKEERATFLEVINQHAWTVLAGAVHSNFFFDLVKDFIPIPSDAGPLTLPQYLEHIPARLGNLKTIYYVQARQLMGQQQSGLFKARGVPILQADAITENFLKKYVERSENLSLRPMASGVVELMEFVGERRWRKLETSYQDQGIIAKAVRFYPPELPAMAVRQSDYDQEQLIKQVMDGSRPVLDFMSYVGKEKSDAYGLCFNVDNPIIQQLVEYEGDTLILKTALSAIYSSALLAAGVELTPELSRTVADSQMRVIELLLEQFRHK